MQKVEITYFYSKKLTNSVIDFWLSIISLKDRYFDSAL